MRKKIIVFILIFIIFMSGFSFVGRAVSASSAVVMLADTKEILYEKNINCKMSMASTTKIMTALIAVESGRLDDVVTVSEKMTKVEGTSMGLKPGNKLTLLNLVKGMMLLSGNDAANAIAYFLSGSLESFATVMNEKAKEIGMANTNFVTPSGLDNEDHYTTAYDMALLASYAMSDPVFRSCVCDYNGRVDYIIPDVSCTYRNHNRFLTMYDGACGIKTGFTKKSGRCLVTAVEKDGCTVVAVTLNAPDDWNDHIYLYDLCLPKVKVYDFGKEVKGVINVAGGQKTQVKVSPLKDIKASTSGEEFKTEILTEKLVYAPIKKGQLLGFVRIYVGTDTVFEYPLYSDEDIALKEKAPSEKGFKYKIKELFRRFERWLITA